MKKLLVAVAAVAAFGAFGESVNVSTVAELTAAVAGTADEIVLLKIGSPYALTAKITVSRVVTIRGETGDPADVVINGSGISSGDTCTAMVVAKAGAVVDGITFQSCKAEKKNGGGVRITAGTIRNCIFNNGQHGGNSGIYGCGVYINGSSAVVSNCVIKNCHVGLTGGGDGIGAYITGGGTLSHTLVTGCYRDSYPNAVDTTGIVYLNNGTVKNCTIAKNTLATSALYVNDGSSCVVKDTICWGNVALREWRAGRPNITVGGSNAKVSYVCVGADIGTDAVLGNPMFTDAANGDFTLMPDSPCIGAGSDGRDLGYKPYDGTKAALGISVGDFKGVGELTTTVKLTASDAYDLAGATVTWEGFDETGAEITHTFGPGKHTITAHVTFADQTTADVALADAVTVGYTGVHDVSTAAELTEILATPADGLVVRLAENTYALTASIGLYDGVTIIGTGDREKTIIDLNSNSRVLNMGHKDALVAGLTLYRGKSQRNVGGVYIHGNGGTVSNCVVRSCKTDTNCSIGGIHLNAADGLVTHSRIWGCTATTGNASYYAGGVLLSNGTLADSLVTGNSCGGLGGGVYMDTSTTDAKVINCTIVGNTSSKSEGGGLYRKSGGGYVYNTIVYGNSSNSGEKNISNAGSDAATRIFNCAADKVFGKNGVALTEAPYDTSTYELDPVKGVPCINAGTNDFVYSETDYFGNARIFTADGKGIVDIGANEYSRVDVVPGVTPSVKSAAGSSEVTFTATVQGAELSDFLAIWYLDGSATPNYTGDVWTVTLGVGKHSMRLILENEQGQTYPYTSSADLVTIYPTDAYCDLASTGAKWPYDTPETAASNLETAVSEVLRKDVTLHVAEGKYKLTKTLSLGDGMHLEGAGMDKTWLWATRAGTSGIRILSINGTEATASDLCVSNGLQTHGGGVHIEGKGGLFTRGMIAGNQGGPNQAGFGAYVGGANSKITRSVIVDNEPYLSSRDISQDYSGGGVEIEDGGVVENCLIRGNSAVNGGGVLVSGSSSAVRNCVIIGNTASNGAGNTKEGCGGVLSRSNGKVVNCIIRDNIDNRASTERAKDAVGTEGNFISCNIPVKFGPGCVTNAPAFRDAANGDYRIPASDPCAYAGEWDDWMDGATDFFGNPRATPGKKVSIGYYQVPNPGLMLLVR